MSLWDPFIFSPAGAPRPVLSPPALRAIGGTPTAQQLGMAQAAFSRFCMSARLSQVPNPTEQGVLPDGTRYRIVVLGALTVMEIWPSGGTADRRSGIGVVFVDLKGGVLPGHTLDNDGKTPQPYLLTPVERKGTREATGKWRIRKVRSLVGGKASYQFEDRDRYVVGVDGGAFVSLPPVPGRDGLQPTLNARAYKFGSLYEGAGIFSEGKTIAAFASDTDALPFFRKRANGELWIMRIAVAGESNDRIELHGQKYAQGRSGVVHGLLDTLTLPGVYVARGDSISISADGKQARMVFSGGGLTAVDIAVGEGSLAITSLTPLAARIPGTVHHSHVGDNLNYTDTNQTVEDVVIGGAGHGFDAKGRGITIRTGGGGREDNETYTATWAGADADADGYSTLDTGTIVAANYHIPAGFVDLGGKVLTFPGVVGESSSELFEHFEYKNSVLIPGTYSARGGVRHRRGFFTALGVLFFDPTTEFVVVAKRFLVETYEGAVVMRGGVAAYEPPYPEGAQNVEQGSVTVMCRGQTLLTVDMQSREILHYAVSAAADPLTGAVLVNLLEFTTTGRGEVSNSWLFLADDQGCRPLHEVMGIPATGVRVKSDWNLLSV